jgi:hypothetical protein
MSHCVALPVAGNRTDLESGKADMQDSTTAVAPVNTDSLHISSACVLKAVISKLKRLSI